MIWYVHTEQHYMEKAALIQGSCSGSTMCIFTHVMENPQNRWLADEQNYKSITILFVLNCMNYKHAKKVKGHPMKALFLEAFKVKLDGPWVTWFFHRLLPSEAKTKCKRLWFWLVKQSILTKNNRKNKGLRQEF